jgi:hypothetical protein
MFASRDASINEALTSPCATTREIGTGVSFD